MRTLAAAALWMTIPCVGALPAQVEVEVRLAADPDEGGPPAWTWLRQGLPGRVEGITKANAVGPLELRFEPGVPARLEPTQASDVAAMESDAYAAAVVRVRDAGNITITLGHDGIERWRIAITNPDGFPARITSLARTLGLDTPGLHRFDVAAAVTQLAPAMAAHDAAVCNALLTRGATECGEVEFTIHRANGESSPTHISVVGGGTGGLMLPAILILLADSEATGDPFDQPATWTRAHPFDATEHWRILAYAARTDARFEAAAQLARCGSQTEVDVLERLLWSDADDATRALAVEGLIRAGSSRSLPFVMDAVPDAAEQPIVHAAFANLWGDANARTRGRVHERTRGPELTATDSSPELDEPLRNTPLLLLMATGSILLAIYLVTWRRS